METIIHRRYTILERLGQGGMGITFKVRDRLTAEVVTLKRGFAPALRSEESITGSPDTRSDPKPSIPASDVVRSGSSWWSDNTTSSARRTTPRHAQARVALAQEFSVLASLRHPNIISVLDYGFDDEYQPYLTMELVHEARDLVKASRAQSLEGRVELLMQTLGALVYLHRRRVVHCDIKPSNVLVSPNLQVKVLDFGISLRLNEAELRSRRIKGTMGYIAPEVLAGEPTTPRSDLFAFGVLACQALLGTAPVGIPMGAD
ncbi:MAG: serine/threonine-protein kinase, partial [Myxococcota bacterium]